MDVLVQPLLEGEEVAAGDLVFQVRHVALGLLEHLRSPFPVSALGVRR